MVINQYRCTLRNFTPPATPFAIYTVRQGLAVNAPQILAYADNLPLNVANEGVQKALELLLNDFKEQKESDQIRGPEDFNQEELLWWQNFQLCLNVESGKLVLWSKVNRATSDWSPDAMKLKMRGKVWSWVSKRAANTLIVYDPFRGHMATWEGQEQGIPVVYCNEYKPPVWLDRAYDMASLEGKPENYPQLWQDYLTHLIPDANEREAVLDWLCLALCSRPISYLSLRGIRGNGTSLWLSMVYHLIGDYYEAKGDVITQFSADLKHKRIVGCDDNENIMSKKGNTIRKNLLNSKISYEEKFVQTKKSERQFASLAILSNPSQQFYVECDERRIVSPSLTSTKLEDVCSQQVLDWIGEFEKDTLESAEHIAFLRQVGESLLARFHNRQPNKNLQLRGGYFWSDVVQSLTSFNRFFVFSLLCENPPTEVSYGEIKEMYKNEDGYGGKKQTWPMFVNWLRSFYMFEEKMPLWSGFEMDDKVIIINPQFREKVIGMYKGR